MLGDEIPRRTALGLAGSTIAMTTMGFTASANSSVQNGIASAADSSTIGTAVPLRGKITRGRVDLTEYYDGPVSAPVMIATGMQPGPKLWIQAAIHGPEVISPFAIPGFLAGLDLSTLKGSINCLLIANPLGFRNQTRNTPSDGKNANRTYPGDPDGSISDRLSYRLFELANKHGDVMVDMHGTSGGGAMSAFYVLYRTGLGEISRRNDELARSVGSDRIAAMQVAWLEGASFVNFSKGGKPAILIESGLGPDRERDVANMRGALKGVCQAMGMVPGKPPVSDYAYGTDSAVVAAKASGYWQAFVRPGEKFVKGQKLGEVRNIYGDIVETVTCEVDSGWCGLVMTSISPVSPGDQVLELERGIPSPY